MKNTLSESRKAAGIRFIRVLWCENAKVIRAKAFHKGILTEHFEHGVGISAAQQAIPVMYDGVVRESGSAQLCLKELKLEEEVKLLLERY